MRTRLGALLGTTALVATTIQLAPGAAPSAGGVEAPLLTVTGEARMYPAYSPAISRYAVHPAPDGSVRVDVTGAAQVLFDGVPDADGAMTFTGLTAGEEISVFVDDGTRRRTHALYVLPAGFPALQATATGAPVEPGNIALTPDRVFDRTSPKFEAIVDRQGVPVYTRRQFERGMDLKLADNGRFTVHRGTNTPGRTGGALVELDDQFQEVRRHETVGLVDTDDHDSQLLPDGSAWLIAYEPNPGSGRTDSIIQHLDPDGRVAWEWSSAGFVADTVAAATDPDYAHINSIDVQPNGDVLASFRHLSSVFLIRPGAGDGTDVGEVVWKLGGRDSDFTFPAGDTGPCAQHAATILDNGNVLLFDNGSGGAFFPDLCVDQDAPAGPPVGRPTSRVVELDLTPPASAGAKGTADVVRTYGDTDRFAWFMASAAKLAGGNVLIGWSSSPPWIATETDPTGVDTIWRLGEVESSSPRFLSYRAALVPARDGFDPELTLGAPADGATVTQGSAVPVSFSCTDRGGSTLQSCDGPAGRRLDTSTPGTHTWTVTARDGAGRTTTASRSYTVTAAPATPAPPVVATPALPAAPDLALRLPRSRWVGAGSLAPAAQTVRTRVRPGRVAKARLQVRNVGGTAGRFLLRAPASLAKKRLRVTYVFRGRTRTQAFSGRGWRTPALAPGERLRLTIRVEARRWAEQRRGVLRVTAASPAGRDRVGLVVRIRPRV